MNKKIMLIPIILVALLAISSCIVTSRAIGVEISCNEFNENPYSMRNEFQAEIGDKITIELCSNPTTGFKWAYQITGGNVIKEEDYDFEEPEEKGLVGASGKEVWIFEAVERGIAVINMENSQPWEGGSKAEWTYIITVTVE